MTSLWLLCLSLLVAADAASIASKPVDIPVQVVYEDAIQVRQLDSLKNLEEKPQLSVEETVEAEVLHIPEVIAKIAQPVQNKEVKNEESSNNESLESSEETVASENTSGEDSREQESNEIDSNSVDNLKLKLVAPEPVEEIEVAEVAAVPIEEAVVLEADAPQVQEVVPEVQEVPAVPQVLEVQAEPEIQEVVPEVEPAQQENVEDVPVEEGQDSNFLRQGNSTTAPPNRPILGLINRLGETVNNAINSFRPQSPPSSTAQPAVAPAEGETQDTKVPLVPEEGLPIAAATAEEEPADAPASPEAPAEASSPATPTFAENLQQNINTQLNTFGNRVNSFINNLRPKQPAGTQSDEEPVTPNTPVINSIQNQFNNGLVGFNNTVNNAFGILNRNNGQQNATQSDETPVQPQNNNPILQTIMNGAANFQQSFSSFITGQNQNQQSDEASPNNSSTNVGQQVLQFFQNGITNIVQNIRPNNTGTQSDEAAPSQPSNPLTGFQNIFGSITQQFSNFISGQNSSNTLAQGIPTQIPGAPSIPSQIPGASSLPNLTNPFPAAIPQLPGSEQIQNLGSLIPGASSLPNFPNPFPAAIPQFPLGGDIPGLPAPPSIPGLPAPPSIPGLPAPASIPSIPAIPAVPALSVPAAPIVSPTPEAPASSPTAAGA